MNNVLQRIRKIDAFVIATFTALFVTIALTLYFTNVGGSH